MNDAELDALAGRAAAHTLAEARAVADSEAALQRLLADAATDAPTPLTQVVPYHGPIRDAERRRRVRLLAVAAVLALFVVGIGFALLRSDTTIRVAGPPAGTGTGPGLALPGTTPTAPPTAASAPDADPAPSTTLPPAGTTATVSTAPPTATAPPVTAPQSVIVPEMNPVLLDELPYLLTQPPPPAQRTYRREDVSDPTSPVLSQLWVRADDGGAVDALVSLTTRMGPAVRSGQAREIVVPGWPAARAWDMAPGYVNIELSGAQSVEIWARGLDEDAVLAIAAGLRADGSSWRSDVFDDGRWTRIHSEWSTGNASRGLVTLDAEGDVEAELTVMRGAALMSASVMLQLSDELRLVDVDDSPGLLGRPGASGLVVVRPDQSVVEITSRDPAADLLAIAGTLVAVDAETWAAAARADLPDRDGCVSLFC